MIQEVNQIKELFLEIDSKISNKVNVFVIGGGALMFHELKPSTKDIDFVVKTKKEYNKFYLTLKELGFKENALTKGGQRFNISSVLEKENARVDLFLEKVVGKMVYSKNMVGRSEKVFEGLNLKVFIASIEDIFVFKSITDREGDMVDCEEIIKQKLNWKIVLEEIKSQTKTGEDVWITCINERLIEFEEKGYKIPILKETEKLAEEFYNNLEKQLKK